MNNRRGLAGVDVESISRCNCPMQIRSMLGILCLLAAGWSSPVAAARPLVISTSPFAAPAEQQAVFQILCQLLEERLGRPVTFKAGTSYAEVIEGLAGGGIDIGFVGASSYVRARRNGTVRAILRSVRNRKDTYKGVVVVRRGSGIKKLKDLRGKKVAFVDIHSTAGYYYPRELLRRAGIDPDNDLEALMAGGHHKVVAMVASGKADAGACFEGAQAELVDPSILSAIARTDPIPGDPVVARAGLGRTLIKQVRSALIELSTLAHARPFFTYADIDSFVPAIDSDYDGVADLMRGSR